jgi:hypothetical protein
MASMRLVDNRWAIVSGSNRPQTPGPYLVAFGKRMRPDKRA